jgi:hypothetical protein
MSDTGRKDITTQVSEKVTPQEHKTVGEKVKESVTGAMDRVKGAATPDSEKSVSQQTADKIRGGN